MGCTKLLWLEVRAGEAHTATPGVSVLAPPLCSPSCACRIGGRGAHTWSPTGHRWWRGRALTARPRDRVRASEETVVLSGETREGKTADGRSLPRPSVESSETFRGCKACAHEGSGESAATLHRDPGAISRPSQRRSREMDRRIFYCGGIFTEYRARLHFAIAGRSFLVRARMGAGDAVMQKRAVFKQLDLQFSAHERSRQHERARNAQRSCRAVCETETMDWPPVA